MTIEAFIPAAATQTISVTATPTLVVLGVGQNAENILITYPTGSTAVVFASYTNSTTNANLPFLSGSQTSFKKRNADDQVWLFSTGGTASILLTAGFGV